MSTNQKSHVKITFNQAANDYDEALGCFNYFGKGLVKQLSDCRGKHVLDVATGRGAVLFPLADLVGIEGKIDAIDLSEEMIKMASDDAKKKGFDHIHLQTMDAENLNYKNGAFDLVTCGFGVFFCSSILDVLKEFNRVLKADGKVALSTWGEDSPIDTWIAKERACFKIENLVKPFWTEEVIQQYLTDAGFHDVKIVRDSKVFYYESPESWWDSLWTHGTRYFLDQLNPKELEELKSRGLNFVDQFVTEKGVEEISDAFYVVASK